MKNKLNAVVAEIFPSIQGEGVLIGQHQLFIRLAGCDYGCNYCDTKWAANSQMVKAKVRFTPFSKKYVSIKNPISVDGMVTLTSEMIKKCGPVNTVVITGGEPLLQAGFLKLFLPKVKKSNPVIKIMLETNGLETDAYQKVRSYVDILSMDIKIKSATGKAMAVKRVKSFLEASKNKYGWIKVVVNHGTSTREIINVAKLVNQLSPEKELIIQPSMKGRKQLDVRLSLCYNLLKTALHHHHNVRLIAQLHKLAGIA